ncbi:MAG: hypothetical protein R3268_10630 [Acidiferrobacterales bacterium]|nr:hypothetical protein [Acidiferrobacterales bacterium]
MRIFAGTMLVVGMMFALVSLTKALEPERLQGEYQLAGGLDHKGSPGDGRSHLYLSLTGEAARSLYATLAEDSHEDPCTGYRVKGRGNVACYEINPNEEYFCSFSINLERGAVEAGLGGCI